MEYTRHKVKWAEYPGIVPYAQSRILCNRELGPEEKSVRGVLVKGLTHTDMIVLDLFEGPEYVRKCVSAHQLGALVKLSEHPSDEESLITTKLPPLPSLVDLAPALDAETYVYKNFENLDAELWSFEDFVKNNARKWYGERHENRNQDDSEVEKRRRAGRGGAAALARYMAAQRSIDDVI
ncbi:hypothetical protein L208DRAFT_1385831 [Tricholoma matsutake]|nr:hypothetical protein L208DRAFT_1385831 [Tricholoma matsutake 945]